MPLSANTVFHFTQKKENLIGILKSNFRLKYCSETIFIGSKPMRCLVPMVSFCDIPLSEIKNHIKSYGPYGIGLSKDWAVKSKLNPVIYMEKDSYLSASLVQFIHHYVKITDASKPIQNRAFFDIFRYMKNYQGDLCRNGHPDINDYRFSDEREWRYVPEYKNNYPMMLIKSFHDKLIESANELIKDEVLYFEPNDIKYIIIQDDSEIPEFLQIIKDAKGDNFEPPDIDKLSTRLLTTKQIHEDI